MKLSLPFPLHLLRAWRDRSRQRHQLGLLNELELRDAGITPFDAWRETNKPFWRA